MTELEGEGDINQEDDFDEIETLCNCVEEEILVLLTITSHKRFYQSNDRVK